MEYEFHVGDYVETKRGTIGFVSDVPNNDFPCWTATKVSDIDTREGLYSVNDTYTIIVSFSSNHDFNRIGQYDFTKKDEGRIEPLTCETASDYSNEKLRKKINELVDAVNRLEEKVNGMAQS